MRDARSVAAERLAPAKVNLGLSIMGRRPDGYHELRSVFLRVGLCDLLEARIRASGDADRDRLSVSGDDECPVEGNIVLRAVAVLRARVGRDLAPLDIHLEKRIPMAAGLGGGSSDGAASLDLAAELWGLELPDDDRNRLTGEVGADVPFFAARYPAALVAGIGDELRPLPGVRGGAGILLVTPGLRLSTADVFAAHDRLAAAVGGTGFEGTAAAAAAVDELASAFAEGLDGQGLAARADRLRDANDLWSAAVSLAPGLDGLRSALEGLLDRPVLLTGSGSTLFSLYASQDEARSAGESLAAAGSQLLDGAWLAAVGVDIDQPPWRFP